MRLGWLLALWPGCLAAQELSLPAGAERTATEDGEALQIATGPWSDGALPVETLPGARRTEAWRIASDEASPTALLADLRAQIEAQGFVVRYSCMARACGGFDFRYGLPVLDPPAMMVDLGDFAYLAATRDADAVAILASRTPSASWIQIDRLGAEAATRADAPSATDVRPGPLAERLARDGHVILEGVTFEIGATRLGDGPSPALEALAAYLAEAPDLMVTIVGHTDADGSLEGNIAISRARAAAVVARLVEEYGVPAEQLTAAGMGYLAPVASNLTDDGRAANRRVEAVVTGRR